MKKMLALGAMAVVLGLSLSCGFEVAPALAVAAEEASSAAENAISRVATTISATDIAAAVARAEEAIAKTANATVNAKEVAAMREYLRGWVAQARTLDLERLTAAQLKELAAALDEGALGLRLVAGVDRKTTAGGATGSVAGSTGVNSGSSSSTVVDTAIAEPRTVKELPVESAASEKTTEVSAVYTAKAEVAAVTDVTNIPTLTTDMNALATLAVAQVKKPTAILASAGATSVAAVSTGAENTEVDVPRTGATDEEEQTSAAVRGMGLVLAGAVVLAAVGAVLIVKRMKRGL